MDDPDRRALLWGTLMAAAAALSARRGLAATNTTIESRPLQGFDAIDWNAVGELIIEQAAAESVQVEAEPAILPKVMTAVRQGRLEISLASGVNTRQPLRVRVGIRSLRALHAEGSGDMRIGRLQSDSLAFDLSGSGSLQCSHLDAHDLRLRMAGSGEVIVAAGRVDSQRVLLSGSGTYEAAGLASRRAELRIDGSGSLRVSVSDELNGQITGSGEITYGGRPVVRQVVTGAGRIAPIDS